jgi:nucleoside-diphosphate-sugar epimerase
LGELAAKLVAAGAASVLITYNAGEDDARRVADEVGDTAAMIRLAVESPTDEAAQAIRTFAPTHVLFFATPTIAKQPSGTFDPAVYDRLQSVYASGLARVLDLAQAGGALRAVFYPSSVYVDTHPTGFTEYVAAKLAGEAICQAWQHLHPDQFVVVDRLPPLVTDQTAAKLGSNTGSNVEILLAALRNLPNGSKSDISEDLLDTASGGAS